MIWLTLIFGKEQEKPAVGGFSVTLIWDVSLLAGAEQLRDCAA